MEKNYSFYFIADLLSREFSMDISRNACIGKHRRLVKANTKIEYRLIKDYLPGKDDEPDDML